MNHSELPKDTLDLEPAAPGNGLPESGPTGRPAGPDAPWFQSLLDALPFPFFYKDAQGRFLGCNQAFEAVQERSRQDLVGKTVFDLLPADEARGLAETERELMGTGGALSFQATVTKPGLGRRILRVSKAAFRHPDGSLAGIATTAMDVTEQVKAEEDRRRSEDLLASISLHLSDLVAILDAEGARRFASPSYYSVLGYSPEELAALPPLGLVHPEDQPFIRQALDRVIREGLPTITEHRVRHRDGRWLTFESSATPIFQSPGLASQALVVSRNITERKAAERDRQLMEVQLRHAQKLESIGSLAAGIAHEINTPTQFIGDNASFLGDTLPGLLDGLKAAWDFLSDQRARQALSPEGTALLRRIEDLDLAYLAEEMPKAIRETLDGVNRVATIVRAMKDFSHPGGEGKTLADLNKAIESTLLVSRNEWKYVARLETDLDPGLPQVPCFPGEINQAILNLVVNAAHAIEEAIGGRHTGQLGTIRVATRLLGEEVRISVSDTGAGIPEAILERIFEPFFTTKPVGKGTGQGLAIVHAVVVEKHGGRATVETRQGEGTTFHLFLPLDRQPPGAAPA
jgi:PAS domain S-box-containing protein